MFNHIDKTSILTLIWNETDPTKHVYATKYTARGLKRTF